jgi:uncharacterized SAM-binding protein YcdF (DUF218 family)
MLTIRHLADLLLAPANFMAFTLVTACLLHLVTAWRRAAMALLWTASLTLFAFVFLPLDVWLAAPIERHAPPSNLPARIDGILVLGGNPARTHAGAALAQRYPKAVLLFSGGASGPSGINHAREAGAFYRSLGLAPSRLLLEDRSVNTRESLVRARAMAQRVPGKTWLLVTSAVHMPRAYGVARKIGWNVIPYSSDYISRFNGNAPPPSFNAAQKMVSAGRALHEYVGLWLYRREGSI